MDDATFGAVERCAVALLSDNGALLSELITAIIAVETTSPADLVKDVPSDHLTGVSIPTSLRLANTRSAARLLKWCLVHRVQIPLRAILPVVKLVEVTFFYLTTIPGLGVFGRSTMSYLVPAVFDRVDPLLAPIRAMMPGGPTQFVALCTMNTLLVAPRARHLDFVLAAFGDWHATLSTDASMWIELGIGRKIVRWLEAAADEDPSMLTRDHPFRGLIDLAVGRLVTLGVPEAHEFERRVATN